MILTRYKTVAVMLLAILAIGFLSVGFVATPTVKALALNKVQSRILSGFASFELASNSQSEMAKLAKPALILTPTTSNGCGTLRGSTKVNQNCLNIADTDLQGRSQAQNEPAIAIDPNNQKHLVAGYNDYRRGDGTCGVSYSLDGGKSWNDATLPNGFTRGTAFGAAREYWQSSGDPSVAWDSKGNAYFDCMQFMRGNNATTNNPDFSSAIYVYRSTANLGASWSFPGRPVFEQSCGGNANVNNAPCFVPVPGLGLPLTDKPYMTVDNSVGSPFQDRIYVTWTLFGADGSAYIMESFSSDYGATFSTPAVVSGNNPTLCPVTFGVPTSNGNCNENQFSQPFTGSDGALYVVFDNYNNAASAGTTSDNRNQVLLAKSNNGGVSFSTPVKVADFYDLPDCATYQAGQDAGRGCVPEKGSNTFSVFRAANYPSAAVNPVNPSQVVVTFGSYINVFSQESNGCVPNGFSVFGTNLFIGVKTVGACNNKILLSISNNGGASFTGTTTDPRSLPTVNPAKAQATTDQWWQWAAFSTQGNLHQKGEFAVTYYDRQYSDNGISDETSAFMDISLSGTQDLTNLNNFKVVRVTSTSMPPPTEFPNSLGNSVFFGDYIGLTVGPPSEPGRNAPAHPIWADTRNPDLFSCTTTPPALCTGTEPNGLPANDQDIFTETLVTPS